MKDRNLQNAVPKLRMAYNDILDKYNSKWISRFYKMNIDYVTRTAKEQKVLFMLNRSHCDGYKKKSKHQLGRAIDVYFTDKNGYPHWSGKPLGFIRYPGVYMAYRIFGGISKKRGLVWGGSWRMRDYGHIEI